MRFLHESTSCVKAGMKPFSPFRAGEGFVFFGPWQETQQCEEKPCPIDCELGEWAEWGECSVTCGLLK